MRIAQGVLDRILPGVKRPARYTGGEWNSVSKDWNAVEVRVALVYPDVYDVGMSNLGLAILYEVVNREEDMLAERVYAPWPDMEEAMRKAGIPLFSLETRHPLSEFDIVGFSLQYELNYTNVLNMLDLAGIPLLACERDESHPLVIAGGSCTYNPEPVSDFFDLMVIGEGEEVLLELVRAYADWKQGQGSKTDFLRRAAQIEGIYVPSFYEVDYNSDGTVSAVTPIVPEVPPKVAKRVMRVLPSLPIRPIVPYIETVHDRAVVEIQRGCGRGCRFCQAGFIYRPPRERPMEEVLGMAERILNGTGYEELSLLSLSSTDHSQIEPMVRELVARYQEPPLSISLPSLRVDAFSVGLAETIQKRRKTGLTFAPEAGTQRLRDVINKNITEEDLMSTVEAAYSSGWHRVKLYFMVGLPTETMEDVAAIADMVKKVHAIGQRYQGKRAWVNVSLATFIPKPHTPFQWLPLIGEEELRERQELLQRELRGAGIDFSWHDPAMSLLEAALSSGDRRLGRAIHRAWRLGAKFDAWDEFFDEDLWWGAFEEEGLDPYFYAQRERALDEVLPWDHIDAGVRRKFLIREYRRSLRGETSPHCRGRCLGCGIETTFRFCPVWNRA